jgi:hypothetical protein
LQDIVHPKKSRDKVHPRKVIIHNIEKNEFFYFNTVCQSFWLITLFKQFLQTFLIDLNSAENYTFLTPHLDIFPFLALLWIFEAKRPKWLKKDTFLKCVLGFDWSPVSASVFSVLTKKV